MTDYRHSGCGWPNGPVDDAAILALPSAHLLMLATEGRYHYDAAVVAGKRVLWRSIPRRGKHPAELGWSPARFVAETINLTDAPTLPLTDFVFANELDLRDERGDGEDDWANLAQRYALIGGWALSVVQSLRQWAPGVRLHWPAWTPDHDAFNYFESWAPAARACQVVDFHAYDSLDRIETVYHNYRLAFPNKPLALTEWHCKGDLEEERRVLAWLAETMAADPLFDAAYFFIWRWHDAPGWWSDAWDVEHNPDRLALFRDPPTAAPTIEEPPMPDLTSEADHRFTFAELWPTIKAAGEEFGFDPQVLAGIMMQESGFRNWRVHFDGTGHGLLGLDDNGMLPGFEQWSGLSVGRGQDAASIPIVPQIRYAAMALAGYSRRLGGPYAAARAWHRGEGLMNDARGRQYEDLIRAHVTELFGGGEAPTVPPTTRVTFAPDYPASKQNDEWSCAPTSLDWAMRSLGRSPGDQWIENDMLAQGVVSRAQGLLDHTGAGIVRWLALPDDAHYGSNGYGISNNTCPITWDQLVPEIDPHPPYPVLLGLPRWGGPGLGHWTGVRGVKDGKIQLANPASGATYGQTELSREQFEAMAGGNASIVRVLHPDLRAAPPVVVPPRPIPPALPTRAELDAEIAHLTAIRDRLPA